MWFPDNKLASHLFDDFLNNTDLGYKPAWASFDIHNKKDEYIIIGDVPGLTESDLDISFSDNRLTVRGTRKVSDDNIYTSERIGGSFKRSFKLPEAASDSEIKAELTNGIITITIAKQAKSARKILISKT